MPNAVSTAKKFKTSTRDFIGTTTEKLKTRLLKKGNYLRTHNVLYGLKSG
jgi:hypothetical protein